MDLALADNGFHAIKTNQTKPRVWIECGINITTNVLYKCLVYSLNVETVPFRTIQFGINTQFK